MNEQKSIHESTGYWVSRLARSMERDFEKRLEPLGITRGAFAVLSAIYHEQKTKPAELAAFLGIDGAAVTRHLDRIENLGFVVRMPSPTDRRSTNIKLTVEGRRALQQGHAGSEVTNAKFTSDLEPAELERFESLIRSMLSKSDSAVLDI